MSLFLLRVLSVSHYTPLLTPMDETRLLEMSAYIVTSQEFEVNIGISKTYI